MDEAVELALARAFAASGRARNIRMGARLSLADVAMSVGVDSATVQRWETGQVVPRRRAAVRWARLMGELEQVAA